MLKKKIWANFQRIVEIFTQKIVTKLSKIWDPRSGIRKKPIPDPGVKKAPDPGSGSATLIKSKDQLLPSPADFLLLLLLMGRCRLGEISYVYVYDSSILMTPPEGHTVQHAYTSVIRILSASVTSVSSFSVWCCSRYVSLQSKAPNSSSGSLMGADRRPPLLREKVYSPLLCLSICVSYLEYIAQSPLF